MANLSIISVKESSSLIGIENFLGWGGIPPVSQKSDQISTHQSPPTPNFYILLMKALLPLLLLEVED